MKSVLDFGAVPGLSDCTEAFEKAINASNTIYVPEGVYRISKPLCLQGKRLVGDGMCSSIIEMHNNDRDAVILSVGGQSCVEQLTIKYADGIVDGSEQKGERIGILTGCNNHCIVFGSSIRNVAIVNTGTAVYSRAENDSESFSVTYDTIEVRNFSYRGFDFSAKNRTGNVYQNIYIHSKYMVDTLFSLETEESEVSIVQLNIEHTRCKYGIRFVGVRALAATSIHIEGLVWSEAALYLENSSGSIEALSVYYSAIEKRGSKLIGIGDGVYDIGHDWALYYPETMRYLRIGTLHLKGINDPNKNIYGRSCYGFCEENAKEFAFVERIENSCGNFTVKIENYAWYTFQNDAELYKAFNCKGNVNVLINEK